MMNKKTVRDIDLNGKRILMRVDYNVPFNDKGEITDDARIAKSLPTLKYCIEKNAKVILVSHLGRPKGKPNPEYSLRPIALHLAKLLGKEVTFVSDCIGDEVKKAVQNMKDGDILLLENLRFYAEETKNDPEFAKKLSENADVFVNDAFGAAHRAHASTEGVTQYLPSVAGFLLGKEIEYFDKALSSPERPFITILGGAKVADKIKLISNLIDKADGILIGGAMAYTFYKVLGIGIGTSKYDEAGLDVAKEVLEKAKEKNITFILPTDRVIAEKFEKNAPNKTVSGDIPEGWMGLDIGPETVEKFKEVLKNAKTIVWNGPVGVCELPPFDEGTKALAEYIAGLDATTIIGGGDTAAAIAVFGLEEKMSHVSTGGGASLKYLEGTVLPGVNALNDK